MTAIDRRPAQRFEVGQRVLPELIIPNPFEIRAHHLELFARVVKGTPPFLPAARMTADLGKAEPTYKIDVQGTTIRQKMRRQLGIYADFETFKLLAPDHLIKITNQKDGICNSCAIAEHCNKLSDTVRLQDKNGNSVPVRIGADIETLSNFAWRAQELIRQGILPENCLEYDSNEIPGLNSGPKLIAKKFTSYDTGYYPYVPPITTTAQVVREVLQKTILF